MSKNEVKLNNEILMLKSILRDQDVKIVELEENIKQKDDYIRLKLIDFRIYGKALELAVSFINERTSFLTGDKYFIEQARKFLREEKL